MRLTLPYNIAKEKVNVEIDSDNVDVLEPRKMEAVEIRDEVSKALVKNKVFIRGMAGKKVAIAVDDHTRPTPVKEILPPLLSELEDLRCDVKILYASGTHNVSRDRVKMKIGGKVLGEYEVVVNDAYNQEAHRFIGITVFGTPVWVNKSFIEADYKIGIGSIFPSEIAGFTGGCKIVLPGVSHIETIDRNHTLYLSPGATVGELEGNIVRKDIDQAGLMAGLNKIMDFVINPDGSVVKCFFGHPVKSHRQGTRLSRRMYSIKFEGGADAVIAAPGLTEDIDFTQAIKSLYIARRIVRRGGKVVMLAAMPYGSEWEELEEYIRRVRARKAGREDILRDVLRRRVESLAGIITYKLYDMLVSCEIDVSVVSRFLKEETAQTLGFKLYRDPQQAIDLEINGEIHRFKRVVALPYAALTYPSKQTH